MKRRIKRRPIEGQFPRFDAVAVWAVAVSVGWAWVSYRPPVASEEDVTERPIQVDGDGYVTSDTCRTCHPHEYSSWHSSYHRTMTQIATPETVIGDFDDVEITLAGSRYRLERRGDEFWLDMEDLDAPLEYQRRIERPIVMTTGSHHMQAYWYATGQGRKLGLMPFIYLRDEARWIPRLAAFLTPQSMGQTSETGRWNTTCIKCHTTHGKPRVESIDEMDSVVAQFGIACEACHGPAEQHIRVNHDPLRRYQYHFAERHDPTIVNPARLSALRASQICGQCHGIHEFYSDEDVDRWRIHGFRYRPGDDLARTQFTIQKEKLHLPRAQEAIEADPSYVRGRFWSDGMVRVSGREYNGLIESPCFKHGDSERGILSCLSCHDMHNRPAQEDRRPLSEWSKDQLGLHREGNQACTQCHDGFDTPEQVAAHTHHKPESSGSLCYNCHMPHTTYGLLKAIRSHQVDSPSVQASLETGRPNACNQCHLDKTLAWTSEYLESRYAIPRPVLSLEERLTAASVLWALRGDAGQRALAAWTMGWEAADEVSGTSWIAPYLAQLLLDPYDAVRFIAGRSLRRLPRYRDFEYDFMAPASHRGEAHRRALEIWIGKGGAADHPTPDPVLMDPAGRLRMAAFNGLLLHRDDRPLTLQE